MGIGARSDLVEVVDGTSGFTAATAVVQVVLSVVGAAHPGLDFNCPSGSLALPETVVEHVGRVRDLNPFRTAVDAEARPDRRTFAGVHRLTEPHAIHVKLGACGS